MSRPRTGTLVAPGPDGIWRARVTKDEPDGTTSRPLYSLETTDETLARAKLKKLAACLSLGHEPTASALIGAAYTVTAYLAEWSDMRKAADVGMAGKEKRAIEIHALGILGSIFLGDVRPSHIRSVLNAMAANGKKKKTVSEVRGALSRMFDSAVEAELVATNPVSSIKLNRKREKKKEREILTDEEIAKYMASDVADLEVRMLGLSSRCEGGMRTGDLHRWDWSEIDTDHFAECIVPRAKTLTPQKLTIPETLRGPLRAWWERAGRPPAGPVFPVRRGKRAGEQKSLNNSYAKRLRRDLFRAGVWRKPPIEVPATRPGQRTDLGKTALGTKLAPNPHDPLYFEAENTLPVDFHSFRRAFSTALAEAGVNTQKAMTVTAHANEKIHAVYVAKTREMRTIPENAMPKLLTSSLPGFDGAIVDAIIERDETILVGEPENDPEDPDDPPSGAPIVTARDDSRGLPRRGLLARRATARRALRNVAPAAGLEPATRRLTAACSTD